MGIAEGLKIIISRTVEGCEVVGTAYNGVEGYNSAQQLNPDIVITDIMMPKVNGLEMIKNLKEAGCKSKFIILSGYSEFEYAKKGIELGVKFFINKPVEEEELHDSMVKVFEEIKKESAMLQELESLRNAYQKHIKNNVNISESELMVSEKDILQLEACVSIWDSDGCKAVITEIFDKIDLGGNLSFSDLKLQCLSVLLYVVRKMKDAQPLLDELNEKNMLSIERISAFETVEQVRSWLTNCMVKIVEYKSVPKLSVKKDIITEIKEYISNNFNEDISLNEVSARFFINPSYLSQLFKEKTGDTYLNYVMKIRINKAKELLKSTNLKVYEICEQVGYSDTNYFSKLFEKIVGSRPSDYKKNEKLKNDV